MNTSGYPAPCTLPVVRVLLRSLPLVPHSLPEAVGAVGLLRLLAESDIVRASELIANAEASQRSVLQWQIASHLRLRRALDRALVQLTRMRPQDAEEVWQIIAKELSTGAVRAYNDIVVCMKRMKRDGFEFADLPANHRRVVLLGLGGHAVALMTSDEYNGFEASVEAAMKHDKVQAALGSLGPTRAALEFLGVFLRSSRTTVVRQLEEQSKYAPLTQILPIRES